MNAFCYIDNSVLSNLLYQALAPGRWLHLLKCSSSKRFFFTRGLLKWSSYLRGVFSQRLSNVTIKSWILRETTTPICYFSGPPFQLSVHLSHILKTHCKCWMVQHTLKELSIADTWFSHFKMLVFLLFFNLANF